MLIDRKSWPLWARLLALARFKRDWGIGDTLARLGKILLIGYAYKIGFRLILRRDCGCEKRQSNLNNKYPYTMQVISEPEFLDENKTVVVELFKPNCPHCVHMIPILEEVFKELMDFRLVRLDGSTRTDLLQKYHVRSSPSYLVFNKGRLAGRFSGSSDKLTFISRIKNPPSPDAKKLYEFSDDQIHKLMTCVNAAQIKGAEAEFFAELKKALQTPFEKR